jgi:hypothetical protein
MPAARRFPPPWTIEEHAESFIVRDANGQALGLFLIKGKRAFVGREETARIFDLDQGFLTGPDQTFAKSRKCMTGASQ